MVQPGILKKTPLHDRHVALGARLVDFAGWEMPVQYRGVIEEHLAVRMAAGLFDVSHMGEILVHGPGALGAVQHLASNDASRLADGQAQYSALLTPEGTPVDDIYVYRLAPERFLLVVNASNDDKDYAWVRDHIKGEARADHESERWAQMALQGPKAETILSLLTSASLGSLPRNGFVNSAIAGRDAMIARTGYTGEDGFEIYCPPASAGLIWDALLEKGAAHGIEPAGLGARDTLRLEACLALYGNDIDESTTLLEAGLGFIVKLDKPGGFIGSGALARQKAEGLSRRLIGFEMVERGIARHGYPVESDGVKVGQVTSGTYGPFVRRNIGMTYLPSAQAGEGSGFHVIIRGKPVAARVTRMPFYKRPRQSS